MPTSHTAREEEYGSHWMERIRKANEYFDKWKKRFRCETLEKYIEGSIASKDAYYLNMFYSSIKVKKPSLLFSEPNFSLTPKPWKLDYNPEDALNVARLKEDTLNSFIQESSLKFAEEIDMAILDSWAYYGMIEVGYDAKWIMNPNAGLPALKSDYYELSPNEKEGKVIYEPPELPEKEWIYFKRIPAHRFRVGGSDSYDLERCNWVGYYEFVRTEDILANKKWFKNIDEKDWPSSRSDDYYWDEAADKEEDFVSKGDFSKIWKLWDNRAMNHLIILESQEKCIYKESFKRLPLFPLIFDKRRTGFYPVPITFNWKSPQDEYNESRNQMRSHRRRVRQMWQAVEQTIDGDEVDKFVHGPDGTLIWVKRDQAIQPIQNAPLDSSVGASLQLSTIDFDKIAGTSNPQRGVSDRTTATETMTIEQRSRVREDFEREIIGTWLCKIARETLLTIMERFSEPFWIKLQRDVGDVGDEVQATQHKYQLMHSSMLEDEVDFELNISVSSLSPVTNEVEKKKFFEFISIMQNFPVMSLHPTLIREAAYRCDYRNEQVIQAVQKMAQLAIMAKTAEGQQNQQQSEQPQGAEEGGTTVSQNIQAQATPPMQEEVRQQVVNPNPTLQ
jgi:hypothetical protein